MEKYDCNVKYPRQRKVPLWNQRVDDPVRKFPGSEYSSTHTAHQWWPSHEVITQPAFREDPGYNYDHCTRNDLLKSVTRQDFHRKSSETDRFCKPNNVFNNLYIYPPSYKLERHLPSSRAHGTSEMKDSFKPLKNSSRLVTEKRQYEHDLSLPLDCPPPADSSLEKRLDSLDTTYEGFEKYLDIYLTTSRLHHRPFTAEQLRLPSNSNDISTYYTFSNVPWVRRSKPNIDTQWLPIKWPKPISDTEKFKQPFREIITHNKPNAVPGAFRTIIRGDYTDPKSRPQSAIANYEQEVRSHYLKSIAALPPQRAAELTSIKEMYKK